MSNEKKNAVVIGATGNLGTAVCGALKEAGYVLDPVWLTPDHPDATKEESYKDLPPQIHLAVYLAGINDFAEPENWKLEDWDRIMNVNLRGAFLFAQKAFPGMKKAGQSIFVGISSVMVTHPYPPVIAYTISKAGIEGMIRGLAVSWGKHGIAACGIRLGHLSQRMKTTPPNPLVLEAVKKKTPSGRLIDPRAVAEYIVFLSKYGMNVSGSIIDFDPAYTINRWPLDT